MSPLIVDADGNVCEPVDLWESRLPVRLRDDFHADASGCAATIVNGRVLMREGRYAGALPGQVLGATA